MRENPYPNMDFERLFRAAFEKGDERSKAELWRIVEIEIFLEVERQIPFIHRICRKHPTIDPQAFQAHVEQQAIFFAFGRKHRAPDEPLGDANRRLLAFWRDAARREEYPGWYEQIQYLAWSLVGEAITRNPIWTQIRHPGWLADAYQAFIQRCEGLSSGERLLLETLFDLYETGEFSEDEKRCILFLREWEGERPPINRQIEDALSWKAPKAHRTKKSIAQKIKSQLQSKSHHS